jgi:hypothetical protein
VPSSPSPSTAIAPAGGPHGAGLPAAAARASGSRLSSRRSSGSPGSAARSPSPWRCRLPRATKFAPVRSPARLRRTFPQLRRVMDPPRHRRHG